MLAFWIIECGCGWYRYELKAVCSTWIARKNTQPECKGWVHAWIWYYESSRAHNSNSCGYLPASWLEWLVLHLIVDNVTHEQHNLMRLFLLDKLNAKYNCLTNLNKATLCAGLRPTSCTIIIRIQVFFPQTLRMSEIWPLDLQIFICLAAH